MAATKLKPVGVVVVGTGVAGSIMCMELASAGLNVVGLERGRMIDPSTISRCHAHDELKCDRHSDIFRICRARRLPFATRRMKPRCRREMGSFKPGEYVGGGGSLGLPRGHRPGISKRARRELYGRTTPEDCTSQDWGSYEELEPYYDQFESIYGVGGRPAISMAKSRTAATRSKVCARASSEPPTRARSPVRCSPGRRIVGLHTVRTLGGDVAVLYDLYRQMLGAACAAGFGQPRLSNGAKASPLTVAIPALLKLKNFTLRPLANVVRVI
jgi:gluconate 2-dehydrogenase alpha chain